MKNTIINTNKSNTQAANALRQCANEIAWLVARKQVALDHEQGRDTEWQSREYQSEAKSALLYHIASPGELVKDGRSRRYDKQRNTAMIEGITVEESISLCLTITDHGSVASYLKTNGRQGSQIPASWWVAAYRGAQSCNQKMAGSGDAHAQPTSRTTNANADARAIESGNASGCHAAMVGEFTSRTSKAELRAIATRRMNDIDSDEANGVIKARRARQLRRWVLRAYRHNLASLDGRLVNFQPVFKPSAKGNLASNFARSEARLYRDLGLGLTKQEKKQLDCRLKPTTSSRLAEYKARHALRPH